MSTTFNRSLPVHLEAVTTDASAGVELKVFQNGVDITTAFKANTVNGLVISDIDIVCVTGGSVLLCANSDTDGLRICGGTLAANSGIVRSLQSPHYCPLATVPKIIGPSTGQTRVILHGFMYRG